MIVNAKSVTVVITCPIQLDKIEMARREFESIIKTVVANEPACHGIHVHDDPKNPRRLLLIEYWDSEEAFSGAHMQTPHMQAFLNRAQAFLDGSPEFGFWREFAVAT
jgi:quinol monooxygenase YgiN